MAGWSNNDLVLYHGCSELSLHSAGNPNGIVTGALPHGINLGAGGKRTEFGQGFSATTWLDQAKSWANRQARRQGGRKAPPRAIVLRFDVGRDALAALDALMFTNENSDFWPFVTYCRSGSTPHGRSTSAGARQTEYDV